MAFFRRQSLPVSGRGGPHSQPVRGDPSEKMRAAAFSNDIRSAEEAVTSDPGVLTRQLNVSGDRAVHLAARMGHIEFVERILTQMPDYEQLLSLDGSGHTPLTYAAISGRNDIATLLLLKNRDLLRTAHRNGDLPLHLSARHGHEGVASLIVRSATSGDFEPRLWFKFLVVLIEAEFYDVASLIISKFGREADVVLKIADDEYGTVLHVLARQSTPSNSYSILVDKVWDIMVCFGYEEIYHLVGGSTPVPVILVAAKVGNLGFISRLLKDFPNLLLCEDEDGHNIFHVAVICRRLELLVRFQKLVGSLIVPIFVRPDRHGNNLLHHAAKVVDFASTHHEMYPLMQLKREIDWFRDMCEVLPLSCRDAINNDNLTPSQLFAKEHEAMLEWNRDWLRRAARWCFVLATLVMSLAYSLILNSIQTFEKQVFLESKHLGTAYFLALYTSLLSVVQFWHLGFWNFSAEHFSHVPHILFGGLVLLFVSSTAVVEMVLCTFSLKFSNPNLYVAHYFGLVTHVLVALLAAYPIGAYFRSRRAINQGVRSIFQLSR